MLVDNKFLFKPLNYEDRGPTINSHDRSQSSINTSFPDNDTLEWNPLCISQSQEEMIVVNRDQHISFNDNEFQALQVDPSRSPSPGVRSIESFDNSLSSENHHLDSQSDEHRNLVSNSSSSAENNLSEIDSDNVLIFNPGQEPDTPENLFQNKKPTVGDQIAFFDERINVWVEATIDDDLSRKWNNYYNITKSDGTRDGLYLIPDTRWTFLPNHQAEQERLDTTFDIGPTTTYPTPDNPLLPRHDRTPHNQESSRSSHVSTLSNEIQAETSLQWDDCGTELTTPNLLDITLDRVQNLDNILPLSTTENSSPINLNDVVNLGLFLPITSTPLPGRRRVSVHRRPLPLETANRQSRFLTLVRRLLPFRNSN